MLHVIYVAVYDSTAEQNSKFPDLGRSHWAYDTIVWAEEQGIVNGLPNGMAAPDRLVTQSEFMAMVNRAFVQGSDYASDYAELQLPPGSAWDMRDYTFAVQMNWAVSQAGRGQVMTRGDVAELLVSVMGLHCTENGSIQYLLDHDYVKGKTSATIEGYKANDTLSRAEAATFIYNLYTKGIEIAPRPAAASAACASGGQQVQEVTDFALAGVMMHDSESKVLDMLGEPAIKLAIQYGFEWYVYNSDYASYVQVGIKDGKVVGLLTNSDHWQAPSIGPGSVYKDVVELYGDPLEYILKGNTQYRQSDNYEEGSVYLRDSYYLTVYYDIHDNHEITAVQLIDKSIEEQLHGFFGQPSDELRKSFERQIFELTNVSRIKHGLDALEWDDTIANTARKHSENMAVQAFFDHRDPTGNSPFDRMDRDGIAYSMAGENIAYGQKDALEVHVGWMNSAGHRKNILESFQKLGVGVYLKSDGTPYYTQNFFTPRTFLNLSPFNGA